MHSSACLLPIRSGRVQRPYSPEQSHLCRIMMHMLEPTRVSTADLVKCRTCTQGSSAPYRILIGSCADEELI